MIRHQLMLLTKILLLLLMCLYIGGCTAVFGPEGCGHAPTWYPPNLLRIWERDDYGAEHIPPFQQVCYDDTWVYYLRKAAKGTDICRTAPGQDATVLHTFQVPVTDIACWRDTLLVYGQLKKGSFRYGDEKEKSYWDSKHGVYLLGKEPSAADPVVLTGTGAWWNVPSLDKSAYVQRDRLPLRAVFNESTEDQPFGLLWGNLFPQSVRDNSSAETYTSLLRLMGGEPECEYHFKYDKYNWSLYRAGDWAVDLANGEEGIVYVFDQYYLGNEALTGTVLYGISGIVISNDIAFYNSYPYALRLGSSKCYIWPCVESGKPRLDIPPQEDHIFLKRYSGEKGRMQYLVSTAYSKPDKNIEMDLSAEYDVRPVASNQITAVDLETMQQTHSLTLPTPHEQVLYVSAAGAYTWRHDEERVYLTDWEGQSKPVSDVIPFTPRYETKQDEAGDITCNVWYVEFDAARSRLLLFDMTQGETALLAAVPVA